MQIQGLSPIELTVMDADGKRVGFLPAPARPLPVVNTQPSVLAEIFGASYSGVDSHPQTITIPDPKAGGYQIHVTGTGDGPFTILVTTLDINGQKLFEVSQHGQASPRSSETVAVNLASDGRVTIPGAPGTDKTPPQTVAALFPQPNASGWNNTALTATLTAADDDAGSGVKEVHYSLSGAQTGSGVVAGSTAAVGIAAEDSTMLTYFAVDNAGNEETPKAVTVHIDRTPPTVVVTRTPLPNSNGWRDPTMSNS